MSSAAVAIGALWVNKIAVMHSKAADGMANSADPDQTAPKEQSDLDLHCLIRPACPRKGRIFTVM